MGSSRRITATTRLDIAQPRQVVDRPASPTLCSSDCFVDALKSFETVDSQPECEIGVDRIAGNALGDRQRLVVPTSFCECRRHDERDLRTFGIGKGRQPRQRHCRPGRPVSDQIGSHPRKQKGCSAYRGIDGTRHGLCRQDARAGGHRRGIVPGKKRERLRGLATRRQRRGCRQTQRARPVGVGWPKQPNRRNAPRAIAAGNSDQRIVFGGIGCRGLQPFARDPRLLPEPPSQQGRNKIEPILVADRL